MSGHDASLRSTSAQRITPSLPGTVVKLRVPRLSAFAIESSFASSSRASSVVVRAPRFRTWLIRCHSGTLPANCSSSATLVCVMVVLVASNDSDSPMAGCGRPMLVFLLKQPIVRMSCGPPSTRSRYQVCRAELCQKN